MFFYFITWLISNLVSFYTKDKNDNFQVLKIRKQHNIELKTLMDRNYKYFNLFLVKINFKL